MMNCVLFNAAFAVLMTIIQCRIDDAYDGPKASGVCVGVYLLSAFAAFNTILIVKMLP
jgi:hypothetical protein